MAIKAVKRDGGNYRARVTYYDDNGIQRSESFTRKTKKEAEAAAYDFKVNRIKMSKPENITLGDAADKFIDSNQVLSPSTIASYRGIRNNAFQDIINKRLGLLTPLMIQTSVSKHAETHKAKTVKNALSFFQRVLKNYKMDHLCEDINIPQSEAKEIKIPTEKDLNLFIESIKETRLYIYVMLACYSGLRRSEVVALTWGDIDFDRKLITINKSRVKNEFGQYVHKNTTKTVSSNRKVGIISELYEALKTQSNGKSSSDRVIIDEPDAMKDAYERARIKYNFPYNYHALRHYFTSYLLLMGAPLKDVSEILGHSTIQTTQRVYLHTFPQTKQEIFDQLNKKVSASKENDQNKPKENNYKNGQ